MSRPEDATVLGSGSDRDSPSPPPRSAWSLGGELLFKPPPKPGSRLSKGTRKSASDMRNTASSSLEGVPGLPRSSSGLPFTMTSSIAEPPSAGERISTDSSSTRTPARRSRGPGEAEKMSSRSRSASPAGSTRSARLYARRRDCRRTLEALSSRNKAQQMAAAEIGMQSVQQGNRVAALLEELDKEQQRQLDAAAGMPTSDDEEGADRIRQLTEKIEIELKELDRMQVELAERLGGPKSTSSSAFAGEDAMSTGQFATPGRSYIAEAVRVTNALLGSNGMPLRSDSASMILGAGAAAAVPTPRQERRARNANARQANADDKTFVTDVQNGLVAEIRRLQEVVAERDRKLKELEDSLVDANERVTQANRTMKRYADSEDTLKQENYDLSLAKQQLEEDLQKSLDTQRKVESEREKVTRELARSREAADAQRVQIEAQTTELEHLRSLREKESAKARKDRAALAREMSDLQAQLNLARTEAATAAKAGLSRSVSHSLVSGDHSQSLGDLDEDAEDEVARRRRLPTDPPTSPGGAEGGTRMSPLGRRLERGSDVLELQSRLDKAVKRRSKLEGDRRKMREAMADMRKAMTKAGLPCQEYSDVESSGDEDDAGAADGWVEEGGTAATRRAVGRRMPKSSTNRNLTTKLGLGPSRSVQSIISHDSMDDFDAAAADGEAQGAANSSVDRASAAVDESLDSDRRHSMEGIDPAFADPTRATFATPSSAQAKHGRRSTIRPGTFNTGSPLARTILLPGEDSPDEASSMGSISRRMSKSVEPEALGDELAGIEGVGDGSIARATSAQGLVVDGGEVKAAHREQEDRGMQTDALPDEVSMAMAERDRQHAELVASHAVVLAQVQDKHAALLAEREGEHAEAIRLKEAAHVREVEEYRKLHAQQLDARDAAHEATLSEKSNAHQETMAAALARQAKAHEAAVQEQRSRHTRALEEQVAERSAALSAAEVAHKRLLAERDEEHQELLTLRTNEHERALALLAKEHGQKLECALAEREEQHAGELEDMQATHRGYVRQVENSFKNALRERDALLETSRKEVEKMRTRLSALENELEEVRQHEAQAKYRAEGLDRELIEAKAATAAAVAAAKAEAEAAAEAADRNESFEDASELPASDDSAADETAMDRSGSPSRSSDASATGPVTPTETEPPIKRAEFKESGCQTDGDMWSRYAQEHLVLTNPYANLNPGVIMLGGAGAGAAGEHGVRDSIGTFGGAERQGAISPAPSMFTVGAITGEGATTRRSIDSTRANEATPDRTKPPTMEVPPPPSLPPPPGLQSKVPRRSLVAATNIDAKVPPRPQSPPPASLVSRAGRSSATGPQSNLHPASAGADLPPRSGSRASGASMPPPSSYVPPPSQGGSRQRPSMASMRTRTSSGDPSANAAVVMTPASDAASMASRRRSISSRNGHQPRAASALSFASDVTSRMSTSSRASDLPGDETMRARSSGVPGVGNGEGTDPNVIHAITQTMIGEYLHKYTRRTMGRGGLSDRRHRRYFWVHPYTKTLYWTISDPGGATVKEGTSKSVAIEDVRVVEDANPNPPGLYPLSIVVCTAARDIKITAPNRERHEMWLTALGYLVNRPPNGAASGDAMSAVASSKRSPRRQRSAQLPGDASTPVAARASATRLSPARSLSHLRHPEQSAESLSVDATPRARGGSIGASSLIRQSVGKRRDTGARQYLQQVEASRDAVGRGAGVSEFGTPTARTSSPLPGMTGTTGMGMQSSVKKRGSLASQMFGRGSGGGNSAADAANAEAELRGADPRLQTAEQMLEEDEKEGYEGLDNVRACCDGKHDVGMLASKHHHHHHHHHQGSISTRRRSGSMRSRRLGGGGGGNSIDGSSTLDRDVRAQSPPPQLGPLNLNAPLESSASRPRQQHQHTVSKASDASSSDWFSAGEGGGGGGHGNGGQSTAGAGNSATATNSSTSYSGRVSAIKRARQSMPGGSTTTTLSR